MIELTQEQRQELNQPEPVAIDPETQQTYVLVRREAYERMKAFLSQDDYNPDEGAGYINEIMAEDDAKASANGGATTSPHGAREALPSAADIAPGILRSQQAFWRDLPELLRDESNRGKWVCYHGDERIGIAKSDEPLIRECIRRGIPDDEYDLATIRPLEVPPWEPEEVEPLGLHHLDDQ